MRRVRQCASNRGGAQKFSVSCPDTGGAGKFLYRQNEILKNSIMANSPKPTHLKIVTGTDRAARWLRPFYGASCAHVCRCASSRGAGSRARFGANAFGLVIEVMLLLSNRAERLQIYVLGRGQRGQRG